MISIFDILLFAGLAALFALHRLHVIRRSKRENIDELQKIAVDMQRSVNEQQHRMETITAEALAVERNVSGIFKKIADTAELIHGMQANLETEKQQIQQLSDRSKKIIDIVPQALDLSHALQLQVTQSDENLAALNAIMGRVQADAENFDAREAQLTGKLERIERQVQSMLENGAQTVRSLAVDITSKAEGVFETYADKFETIAAQYLNKADQALESSYERVEEKMLLESGKVFIQLEKQVRDAAAEKQAYEQYLAAQKQQLLDMKSEAAAELEKAVLHKNDYVARQLAQLETDMQHALSEARENYGAEIASIKELASPVARMVDELAEETRAAHEEIVSNYQKLFDAAQNDNEEFMRANKSLREELAAVRAEFTAFKTGAMEQFGESARQAQNLWDEKLREYDASLSGHIQVLTRDLETVREEHEVQLDVIVQGIEARKEALMTQMEKRIADEEAAYAKKLETETLSFITAGAARFDKMFAELRESGNADIDAAFATYESLCAQARSRFEQYERALSEEWSEYDEKLGELEASFDRRMSESELAMQKNLDDQIRQFTDDVKRSTQKMRDYVENAQHQLEETVETMQQNFAHSEDSMGDKMESIQKMVRTLETKHAKQVALIEEDTNAIKELEKIRDSVMAGIDRAQQSFEEIQAKYNESEKLQRRVRDVAARTEQVAQTLAEVLTKETELGRILRDHEKMSRQVEKIDARSAKISEAIDLLQSKEEKISVIKAGLGEIQAVQKDVEKHRKDLERNQVQYQVVLDTMHSLEGSLAGLEKKSAHLNDEIKIWDGKINETNNTLSSITQKREEINAIAAKVEATQKNIPDIMRRLEEINNAQGRVAELETRLQTLNEQAESKLVLLSTITTPAARKKSARVDERTREIVRGLYEHKYPVESIARHVNLSVSEVQMVLENMMIE